MPLEQFIKVSVVGVRVAGLAGVRQAVETQRSVQLLGWRMAGVAVRLQVRSVQGQVGARVDLWAESVGREVRARVAYEAALFVDRAP